MQPETYLLAMSTDEKTAVSAVASLSGFKRDIDESNPGVMSYDTVEETDMSISSRSTLNERTAKMPRIDCNGQINAVEMITMPAQISSTAAAMPGIIQSYNQEQSTESEPQGRNLRSPSLSQSSPSFGPQPPPNTDNQKTLPEKFCAENMQKRSLRCAPFFYYRDFSQTVDEDPLIPLTPLARVPNFPAKMHSILSRPSLSDVVSWMPHGRSWRVLKPRDFEIRVIPTYFEHQKFSSFIRQANGWGFRRITQGRDRNSYYHELFLRGLPHLCKKMKRPGVNKKVTVDAEHEPEFYAIGEMHPLPGGSSVDVNLLLPSSLLGRNDWSQTRAPAGISDMIGHNSTSYGGQSTPGSTGRVNSQGQGYSQDAALKHDPSSIQTHALASLSSIHGRNNLYSQLQGLPKPDPTPRTNAAAALTSNPSSSRTHYSPQNLSSLAVLQQALRNQQQAQAQGDGSTTNQPPASQQATLSAIAAALNMPIHEQSNPRNSPPQTTNQAGVTNSLLQTHKQPTSSSQIYALNQQVQLAAIQRATSALQHAMSPAAAAAIAAHQRRNNASTTPATAAIPSVPSIPAAARDTHQTGTNKTKETAAILGDATSQFAAGFAAATALSNSHVRSAVNEALANHAQAAAANRQQAGALGEASGSGGAGIDGNGGTGQRRGEGGMTREQMFSMYPNGNFYK